MAKKNQLEIIDEQIKKKQDKMFVLKGQIDTLADEVKELLKQKEEVKKEGLMEAIEESGRTYDEILANYVTNTSDKSKWTAFWLCLFLGGIGWLIDLICILTLK